MNSTKAILVIFDGLGDRLIPEFSMKTPLEAALTPNLDSLAKEGITGLMSSVGRGVRPGSDVAHLALFGYDPHVYYAGRGPIEAAGIGLKLEGGDVAFRANLGTVAPDGKIIDRRAGRIRNVAPLTETIDGMEFDGIKCIVRPGTAHRAVLVLRGKGLSSAICDIDPHADDASVSKASPLDNSKEAAFTASVLQRFLDASAKVLREHPLNAERKAKGEFEANYLLLRAPGQYKQLPSFEDKYHMTAACVAGGGLYKGIGAYLGMKVLDIPGATALPDTDIRAKFNAAIDALSSHDFVFVHVKATDSLGEDGNFEGKKKFIERIDEAITVFKNRPQGTLLALTADHSTPCIFKAHSADPVPVLMHGDGVRPDEVTTWGERACQKGGLGWFCGSELIPEIANVINRLHLFGG